MRNKPGFVWKRMGCCVVLLGVLVLLGLILPPGFWWFIFGAILICTGIWIIRCR